MEITRNFVSLLESRVQETALANYFKRMSKVLNTNALDERGHKFKLRDEGYVQADLPRAESQYLRSQIE